MRLVIEEGDFAPETGKSVTELQNPQYGFRVNFFKQPGRAAFATITHQGGGFRVEGNRLAVEVEGKELGGALDPLGSTADREHAAPAEEKPAKAGRNTKGQFLKAEKAEPALTGPRLQDTSAWGGE